MTRHELTCTVLDLAAKKNATPADLANLAHLREVLARTAPDVRRNNYSGRDL